MTKELLQRMLDLLEQGSFAYPTQLREDLKQALAQQERPASVEAYVGAREDAAIWKKRALEAEELNRKFIAELNGPTYLGEPVKQEQPISVCVGCCNADSWGLPDKPTCAGCVSGSAWTPLNRDSVNPNKPPPTQPAQEQPAQEPVLTAIYPEKWEPCSPSWLDRGGNCDKAPRLWNASTREHWHPIHTHPAPIQPAQGKCKCGHVGTSITVVESFPVHSVSVDEEDPDYKEHYHGLDVDATLQIGLEICRNCKTINGFWIEDTGGAEFYADWGKPRYTHPAPIQPAQDAFAVVPRTMILEDADLRFLHALSQPDEEDGSFSPIALTVGDGHTGHGLYATLAENPEEGADIICKFASPTQPALSDDDLHRLWRKAETTISARPNVQIYGRLIEAHCRGGANG